MPDWIADWFLKIVTAGPAWILEEGSANYMLFRVLAGLMVVLLAVYLFVVRGK